MSAPSVPLFASAAAHTLCAGELAAIAPEVAGVYGSDGLFVRAHATAPAALSVPMIGRLSQLHVVAADRLGGDVACTPSELPFEDDSFRLVVVQHAGDVVADAAGLRRELARVLAPQGLAVIIGFHPTSLWRPWLALRRRRGLASCSASAPALWCAEFRAHGIEVYARRRLGSPLPGASGGTKRGRTAWLRGLDPLRPCYLLLGRKRRAELTPLKPLPRRELALAPQLASGTHRACA